MTKKKPSYKINDFVYTTASGDQVIFEKGGNYKDPIESDTSTIMPYVSWGKDDKALYDMANLCYANPTKWRLITTRRDFVIADGIQLKKKIGSKKFDDLPLAEGINTEEFLDKFEFDDLMSVCALMLEFCGRFFVKVKLVPVTNKIAEINNIDVFHLRPMKLAAGESTIKNYSYNPNFGNTAFFKVDDCIIYPAYDPSDPTKYKEFIYEVKEKIPGQFYNPFGLWWGTKDWTRLSNKIPLYHEYGVDNGYNIKYHVEIPNDYFEREDFTPAEEEELKTAVLAKIDSTLKGKTDSVFFTFYDFDINGKTVKGVKVTPLQNTMTDDAYMNIFQMANQAQIAAHGVLPVLGGIDTGSKLGGSGKEMEVAANYTQNFLTANSRRLLLKVFDVCKKIEGWPIDVGAQFKNIEIYTPDVTPTAASVNPNNDNNGTGN